MCNPAPGGGEVLPAARKRMALTYWWFDRGERAEKVRAPLVLQRPEAVVLPTRTTSTTGLYALRCISMIKHAEWLVGHSPFVAHFPG